MGYLDNMFALKHKPQSSHAKYSVRMRSAIDRLYDLRYEDEDGKFFYFVLVEPEKEAEFLQVLNSKTQKLFLKEFGKIIEMGAGEPSLELIQQMQDNFDITYSQN